MAVVGLCACRDHAKTGLGPIEKFRDRDLYCFDHTPWHDNELRCMLALHDFQNTAMFCPCDGVVTYHRGSDGTSIDRVDATVTHCRPDVAALAVEHAYLGLVPDDRRFMSDVNIPAGSAADGPGRPLVARTTHVYGPVTAELEWSRDTYHTDGGSAVEADADTYVVSLRPSVDGDKDRIDVRYEPNITAQPRCPH